MQKSETLALKKLYQLQKMGYFWILIFELNLSIIGILAYNVYLGLFNGKKKEIRDEKRGPDFKNRAVIFTSF
jgi:hypothetical protein